LRFRIIIERDLAPPALEELELFKSVMTNRRPKFRAFFGSLAVHVAVLALIVAVSRYLSWYHEDDVDWSQFHAEPLRLHLAERIFFNASAPGVQKGAGTHPDRAGKSAIEAKLHSAVPDGLQLPTLHKPVRDSSPLILQPDLEPQAPRPPAALPALAFWARQAPDLPRPRPREVVAPGRTETPSPAPKPAGPPVLEETTPQAHITDVKIASTKKSAETPASLLVPNTATVPVLIRAVTDPRTASFEAFSGQPVNIIALAAERSGARNVEIPRGFQNIPNAAAAGDGASRGTERESSPGPAVGGTRQGGTQQSGASVPPLPVEASTPVAAPPELIRIQHPANGNFDVVITQSLVRDDLPDLSRMLSGSPVYTVYLSVGDLKDWLLEYCVPARENKQRSPYQIDVDDAGSVTPPYPISTIIPDSIRAQQSAKPIVLRGLLTAAGSVQVAKLSETGNSLMYQLVALVSQWQFRPALRNNKPIDVEVLLVIPPRV
jgi:hypothetical protein